MGKFSSITRASILLAFFFFIDKIFAFIRSVIIARQFDLSSELDAFNIANNLPDLLFAMISGGAIAMAFIPVLTESVARVGKPETWRLFSKVANFAFVVTSLIALLVGIFSENIVRSQFGIAPGFDFGQQVLVVKLMRLNLIGTIIFSISGLVMAGLQANKHFFLPALAPSMYNIGMIIGALIFSPSEPYVLGGVALPAFGFGVEGLVYGVILGALMHLGIQVPGLVIHKFRWTPSIAIRDEGLTRALRLISPRLLTMFGIQMIFIMRDNFATRLDQVGVVSSLTYGWMIMQVPETIIGTAIATALLPSLAEYGANADWERFSVTISKALRLMVAISLPITVILGFFIKPLIQIVFGFDEAGTEQLTWTTRVYLLTLIGYATQETLARAFYARLKAWEPVGGIILRLVLYLLFALVGIRAFPEFGASVIAFGEVAVLFESGFLLYRLQKDGLIKIYLDSAIKLGLVAVFTALIIGFGMRLLFGDFTVWIGLVGMAVTASITLYILRHQLRELSHL